LAGRTLTLLENGLSGINELLLVTLGPLLASPV